MCVGHARIVEEDKKNLIGASLLLYYLNMAANCFIQCPLDPCFVFLIRDIVTYGVLSFVLFFLFFHMLSMPFHLSTG
jgi:hypothetical protein